MNNKIFNKVVGDKGEGLAISYLKKQKYKILTTNFKNKIGEIDIIAKDKGILVFIEVKYRTNDYFGLPREAVTDQKQRKIKFVATSYITKNNLFDCPCRFDVVEILDNKINLIKDCF